MTTAIARKVLIEFAESTAATMRQNDPGLAAGLDTLAAELRGPSDLATATRLLADDYQEAGYAEIPDVLRVLAEITEGKFPCGHEVQGPPVDGREVDRAPDIVDGTGTECPTSERADRQHSWRFDGDDPYVICHYCGEMRDALTGRVVRGPQTDGGVATDPPRACTPPSPHATKES